MAGISCLVLAGFVQADSMQKRNLKVLPQDISDERLDSLMQTYNQGLGVSCDFCHAYEVKNGDTLINFAAEDNPVKEEGRRMIRLTMGINQKYFNFNPGIHPAYLTKVSCYTCHKGDAYPQSEPD
ncbi:hypothetical protein GCM10027051_18290 [Niabella terrae]